MFSYFISVIMNNFIFIFTVFCRRIFFDKTSFFLNIFVKFRVVNELLPINLDMTFYSQIDNNH